MTSLAMHRVANRISRGRLGESALVYLDGVEHPTRFTRVRKDELDNDAAGRLVRREHRIRVPVADFPRMPAVREQVEIGGKTLFIAASVLVGPSYVLTLTTQRPN